MTLFVIIAIIVVAAGILIYQFVPGIKNAIGPIEENPNVYIQNCLEDDVNNFMTTISRSGGMLNPDHPYSYIGEEIDYLCYTSEYRTMCTVENPMLINQFEEEMKKALQPRIDECFDNLVTDYQRKGYDVSLRKGETFVSLVPSKLEVKMNNAVSLTKGETNNYESFSIILNNNLYELISIAYNILNWEAAYGDAYVDAYMLNDPNIRIDKIKRGDGTKIYSISERDTELEFRFASRSLVAPPGFGVV